MAAEVKIVQDIAPAGPYRGLMTNVQQHRPEVTLDAGERGSPGIAALLELVRDRADAIERTRRLPDDVVAAVRRSGLNRMLLPTALGGLQAMPTDVMDVIERIAAVDASAAWCAVIGAGSNLFAGYLPESGARRVFSDPDAGSATMFAPAGRLVPDGDRYRLTGRWPFTSNCLHSDWIGVGALIERAMEPGGAGGAPGGAGGAPGGAGGAPGGAGGAPGGPDPVPRIVFVPAVGLTVDDTWDSTGLRGTGSHDVVADDLAVEADQFCTFAGPPWPEGTLWRLPLHTVLVPLLSCVALGIARGAIDEIGRQAREGRSARRGQLGDDPVSLAAFASADTRLRAAHAGLRTALDEARELAERSAPVDKPLRARIFLAALAATDVGVEVTSTAHQLAGAAAAYQGHRLLRALNDVQAARQHLLFSPKHLPELAKGLAGLDVVYPPFFLS
jgi:alkylation response protein AidB-like acyl-CoA dehydrogenase